MVRVLNRVSVAPLLTSNRLSEANCFISEKRGTHKFSEFPKVALLVAIVAVDVEPVTVGLLFGVEVSMEVIAD